MIIITKDEGRTALSYWFPNNNFCGSVKDIIGFSYKSYFTFKNKKEAEQQIKLMFDDYNKMEGDLKLSFKIYDRLKKLRVMESQQ